MKRLMVLTLAAVFVILATALPSSAWNGGRGGFHGHQVVQGHGHGHGASVVIVPRFYGPRFYPYPYSYSPRFYPYPYSYEPPYPYVYSPPVVIERQPVYVQPPTYIQQSPTLVQPSPTLATQEPYYWYYCEGTRTYYPYVQQCPGGWLKVVPPTESRPAVPGQAPGQ